MIANTDLLGGLARSVNLSAPESGDSAVTIPQAVFPSVHLPLVLTQPDNPAGSVQEFSFHGAHSNGVTNGAAANSDIATITSGLWEFHISMNCIWDWALGFGETFSISLVSPGGTVQRITEVAADGTGAGRQFAFVTMEVLLQPASSGNRTWTLRSSTPAAGVAQTNRLQAVTVANRLL